jgi:glycosyltransferase involved in cell wall biosynthesis
VTRRTRPLVSVLLPVRNGARFLEEALGSILAQTVRDVEVVAVDDGSTDTTPTILADAARRDARIRVLRTAGTGLVGALEVARAAASAPLLARMDADDRSPPDRLERQLRFMEQRPDVTLCGTAVRYFPRDLLKDGTLRYERWLNGLETVADIERDLFVECPLAHPTFVMRADVIDRVGGYREGPWPEDYDLVLRLWEGGARMARVHGAPLEWRDHPARLSRVHERYALGAFRALKVDAILRSFVEPEGRAALVWGAGPTGKAFSRLLAERGAPPVAFVDLDPRKIGQTIHDAPVVPPAALARFEGAFCLAAVAQPGGRDEIRSALNRAGWQELRDYVAVA